MTRIQKRCWFCRRSYDLLFGSVKMQALRFFMSSNLTVHGLKVTNSPQFHFRFDNCQNVHVETLNIRSPASSPNTDGIHIENTNNVQIYNSLVSSGNCRVTFSFSKQDSFSAAINAPPFLSPGDDCISIGAGSYNVHINNVTCGPSHGIRYTHRAFSHKCYQVRQLHREAAGWPMSSSLNL